jgi:phage-related protein
LKALTWGASSYRDLIECPDRIQDDIGHALEAAQRGKMAKYARPMKGDLRDVVEVRVIGEDGTYRAMYTTSFGDIVYVLDVFKKKSKQGNETPRTDLDRIRARLRRAKEQNERNN